MLLSEPLASLITFFRTGFIKFYLNSQRISDFFFLSHNWIKWIKLKSKGPSILNLPCRLAVCCCFCVRWHHDVNIGTVRFMMSWNLIWHVYKIRKFVMVILHWKQGLLYDKYVVWRVLFGKLWREHHHEKPQQKAHEASSLSFSS